MRLRLTAGAFWVRDAGALPRSMAIEMLAQAAAYLLAGEDRGAPGYLAGVEDARWSGDLEAGDELEARVILEAKLGPLAKVAGSLLRQGEELFTCRLIVRTN